MAFLRLCTLFLVLVLEFSLLQIGIADDGPNACRIALSEEEGLYRQKSRLGSNMPSTSGEGENYNLTVKFKNKEVKCLQCVDILDILEEPNNISIPQPMLKYLEKYKYEYYGYYTIMFYSAGSKLDVYMSETFNVTPVCAKAYWFVVNIFAKLFVGGYNSKKGGDVVFEYEPPLYCPGSRYVIQLYGHGFANRKIINAEKSVEAYPFDEYKLNQETFEATEGEGKEKKEKKVTLGSAYNTLGFFICPLKIVKLDKTFRKLGDMIMKKVEELKPSLPLDKIKENEDFKKLTKLYEETKKKVNEIITLSKKQLKEAKKQLQKLSDTFSTTVDALKAKDKVPAAVPAVPDVPAVPSL